LVDRFSSLVEDAPISLRDGVYDDTLSWSGYGGYSFDEMETDPSGFDIDNHLNANLTDQWDGFRGEAFATENVSLDMENGARSAEFTRWVSHLGAFASRSLWTKLISLPLAPFEFEALPNISPSTEIGSLVRDR
jgi:hypothetical protein